MAATNSNTNRRSARNGSNQEAPAKPDQLRSLNDWKQLPVETLKLKCDANRLPNKGKKLELSLRLFQHFHPDGVARVRKRNLQKKKKGNNGDNAGNTTRDVDDLPPAPPEIIRAEDDVVDTEESNSTQPYDDDEAMGNAGTTTDVNDVNDGSIKLEETRRVSRVLAWR